MAPRRLHRLAALLVLALALGAAVDAQGPSDTGNSPPGTPTTPPPGVPAVTPVTTPPAGNVPTTPPPNGQPQPTPSTKKPVAGVDTGSSNGGSDVPSKTPAPSRTTKAPVVAPATPGVTPATPAPPITQTPAEILVDRQAKSEYGTRPPSAATDTSTSTSTSKSEASKMGSWLAPAIIGAVIISALIVMTFFVRSHRSGGNADEDLTTPQRRGSDNFHELPKSTTHHVNVPVLGDPVKDKVAAEQNHMRVAGMNGVLHSPRANRVASSPPLMAEPNRAPSPGFGAYKQ